MQCVHGMQHADGESRARTHSATGWQVGRTMHLDAMLDAGKSQYLASCRVHDLVDRLTVLDLGIDDAELVFKERRQVAARDITVFVDRRGEHRSAMLTIPSRIVRTAAKE